MAICGDRNWRSGSLGVFRIIGVLAHVIFCCENHALAQITPDGTLGDRSSTRTPNVNIKGLPADRIDGGATRGANLFHSFQEFNVGESQRVYFANPTGIKNILTRVTGSNISNILGTLGVDGGANLFLINPNGILFGNNARLDVAGSFVGSTANSFMFGNGLEFSATNPQTPSPLLTVNPSALFFNQIAAAPIQNNSVAPAGIDPAGFNAYGLRVGDGKSLLLVGGNVIMDGGQLNAYGGRVELGGLAAVGNVNLLFNGDNLSLKFPLNVTRADVSLTNEAFVYVEAAGGGDIAINARNIDILGGSLLSAGIASGLGQPEATAGDITLNATGEIKVADSRSRILNIVSEDSKGNGGNITIDSGDFSLGDGAFLSTSTSGVGNAGNIRINAKDAINVYGTSQKRRFSSALFTFTDSTSTGKGGDITINTNIFRLSDGALLDARTRNNQKGGDITVNANIFDAFNGGQLTTTTSSNGRAGKITVNADDKLIISGIDPSYSDRIANFPDNVVNIGANSGLFVSSTASGITGDIEVNSPQITLDNQGKLNASSASGNGGNINANSDLLLLRHGAQISTNAGTAEKGGNGGNININSKFLVAVPNENSDISANAFTGIGGRVDITTDGLFGIVPQKSPTEKSDITASSQLGVSGEVIINTPDVDPSRGLIQLPSNLVDVSQQITQGCTPRRGQNANRFIATGRGGLPQSPNEPLRGRAVITGWVDLPPQATKRVTEKLSTTVTKSTDQIVEAQGWIVDAKGDVILVAQSGQSSSIPSAMFCSQ